MTASFEVKAAEKLMSMSKNSPEARELLIKASLF